MKRAFSLLLALALLTGAVLAFSACGKEQTILDPDDPVTLTMWHVYGEQADSPMNRYIETFNRTGGRERGIVINVTLMSNATAIGDKLLEAQSDKPGAPDMPDLFFCHNSNAAALGAEHLLDWKETFTEAELATYVSEFVADGMVGDSLSVFPVSKSTFLLFVAGGVFDRFARATGVTDRALSTWDGFFDVAAKYYEWSGGKPFCAVDYLLRCVELDALSRGAGNCYDASGDWYDPDCEPFLSSYRRFADAIARGHIIVSDLYSNTQVMTGETAAGIGSSASVLYYNDKITYPDNTTEPTDLRVFPLPQAGVGTPYATQAGVGLCAYRTTEQKAEAATVFARWLTEEGRNLDLVAAMGYMPVRVGAFEKIDAYNFDAPSYTRLYRALRETKATCTLLPESSSTVYFGGVHRLYAGIRTIQKELTERYARGETAEEIAEVLTELLVTCRPEAK